MDNEEEQTPEVKLLGFIAKQAPIKVNRWDMLAIGISHVQGAFHSTGNLLDALSDFAGARAQWRRQRESTHNEMQQELNQILAGDFG